MAINGESNSKLLERGLKTKSMRGFKVRAIVLNSDWR